MANERIKVYGTSWCPDTARARFCFQRLNEPYDWCDIEKDREGCDFVESVNGRQRIVPTIVFKDGSILVEPSISQLEKKIEEERATG
jgi:mycoredoxin